MHNIPDHLPESLIAALVQPNPVAAAIGWANMGLSVVPVWPINNDATCACGRPGCPTPGKHPLAKLVPHGIAEASCDPQTIQQWFALFPDANIGLRMGDGIAALDIDPRNGGDVIGTFDLAPTLSEQTGGSGEHRWFRVPPGQSLQSRRLHPGVELKGRGSMIISAPSRHVSGQSYVIADPHHHIAVIPGDWQYWNVPAISVAGTINGALPITPALAGEIAWVRQLLLAGPHAMAAADLITGAWHSHSPSQSEADYLLVLWGSALTKDPVVLDGLLRTSGLFRAKWDAIHFSDGATYGQMTIFRALQRRKRVNHERRQRLAARSCLEPTGFTNRAPEMNVTVAQGATVGRRSQRIAVLEAVIQLAMTDLEIDENHGWARVPMDDLAQVLGVHRNTIRNAILDGVEQGVIETRVEQKSLYGRPVKDRLVRLRF